MIDKMRQELNGVKTAINELGAQVTQLGAQVTQLGAQVAQLGATQAELQAEFSSKFSSMQTQARKTAITVAGHTENFARIEKKLAKLDEFDGLKNSLDVLVSEILASRSERTLRDKSFSDQQAMLTDHELRLTRIELRGKQS